MAAQRIMTKEKLAEFIDFNTQPPRLKLPMTTIAKIVGCSHITVRRALRKYFGFRADNYGRLSRIGWSKKVKKGREEEGCLSC